MTNRRDVTRRLTAIDLFSGVGGLSLGLDQAGFAVVGAIENDGVSAETYRANHQNVRLWEEDITRISPGEMRRELGLESGDLDLVAGCPPCQGFSSIRTRNGSEDVEDPRNDLIYDFIEYVVEFRPCAVMMENVPGLMDDQRFTDLRDRLESEGYRVRHDILNVAAFGVPQNRRRLVVLAGLGEPIDFADPHTSSDPPTVRSAISDLPNPGQSGDPCHDVRENRSDRIMRLIRAIPKDGGGRLSLDEELQLDCHKDFNGFKDVYGRMAWDRPAPTITCGCVKPSKGRFIHPKENRAITPREAALLQSFPPEYAISMSRGKLKAAEMIGNALPPKFARAQSSKVAEFVRRYRASTQSSP